MQGKTPFYSIMDHRGATEELPVRFGKACLLFEHNVAVTWKFCPRWHNSETGFARLPLFSAREQMAASKGLGHAIKGFLSVLKKEGSLNYTTGIECEGSSQSRQQRMLCHVMPFMWPSESILPWCQSVIFLLKTPTEQIKCNQPVSWFKSWRVSK